MRMNQVRQATSEEMDRLADWMRDTPETVISRYALQRRQGTALLLGDPDQPEAVLIESDLLPGEPSVFGDSEDAIMRLIGNRWRESWSCLNVPYEYGERLGEAVRVLAGADAIRWFDDVYHVLETPSPDVHRDNVRLLHTNDSNLLISSRSELYEGSPTQAMDVLRREVVAAAIENGEMIAIAMSSAISENYADIGVATLVEWRGQGLSTAAASLVARAIQAGGRTPVWSCGDGNTASLRVARKLGFQEVSRRRYIVPVRE